MSAYRHSRTTAAVLRSLVPVICPPEAHGLADAIVAHLALTLDASPPLVRAGLAAGLAAYDLGALPRHGRRARHLSPDAAERYFASWEHGPTPLHVQLARALNQLMSLSCYEQPEMMERVGYRPGPWIEEMRRKRLTVHQGDVRRQEAQVLAPDPLRPGVQVRAMRARPDVARPDVARPDSARPDSARPDSARPEEPQARPRDPQAPQARPRGDRDDKEAPA